MKIKNQILLDAVQGIQTLAQKELPYKTSLKLSKNINIIENLLKDYNKEYQKLANEYCIKDENGHFIQSSDDPNYFLIKDDKREEYLEKISILNNFENEINLYKIDPEELEDIKISAMTLLEISFMINEKQEDQE